MGPASPGAPKSGGGVEGKVSAGREIFGLLSSLLEDISEGKTLSPALAEKSNNHRDICSPLLGGLAPSACLSLLFPESLLVWPSKLMRADVASLSKMFNHIDMAK